jgi:hypothetical protein
MPAEGLMEAQLQQLIELQTEQNELLKRHLLRLRFSLAALLMLTTACCLALGYVTYQIRSAGRPIPTGPFYPQPSPPSRVILPGIPQPSINAPFPAGPQPPINPSHPISGTSRPSSHT